MKTGILKSLPSGVVVIDHRARIVDVNDKWTRLAKESGLLTDADIAVGANLLDRLRRRPRRRSTDDGCDLGNPRRA